MPRTIHFDMIELPIKGNPTLADYCVPSRESGAGAEAPANGLTMQVTTALDDFLAHLEGRQKIEPSVYDMRENTPVELPWPL